MFFYLLSGFEEGPSSIKMKRLARASRSQAYTKVRENVEDGVWTGDKWRDQPHNPFFCRIELLS